MSIASWLVPERLAEFAAEGTTAHRIYSSGSIWAERFGESVLISHRQAGDERQILNTLDAWLARTGLPVSRIYSRLLVHQPTESNKPILMRGDANASTIETVSENGLRFEVDFSSGYSVGLFCDQRENRKYLQTTKPARLLNTFAYTCAFSVAAAREGSESLNVDLSKQSLARGKRNFELNAIPLTGHKFIADDVFAVLPRLARRGEQFDAIILDPPTFSRGNKAGAFRAERDYIDLLKLALACAAPGAAILLSTNCSSLGPADLRVLAKQHVPEARFHGTPRMPDIPDAHAASTQWLLMP